MRISDEGFWKNEINAIPQDLSPKGLAVPALEKIKSENLSDMRGKLDKITFNVYFFTSAEDGEEYMVHTGQSYQQLGQFTLGNAIRFAKSRRSKK